MNKYIVELTEDQLKQLGIEVEPEFTYPLVKRSKRAGAIIKFTSMSGGTTVWKGNTCFKIGYVSNNFIKHTSDEWEDVAYDSERDLWDGQPVECWDDEDTHRRHIRFYNAKDKSIYSYKGERDKVDFDNYKVDFDNYKAIPSDRYDE